MFKMNLFVVCYLLLVIQSSFGEVCRFRVLRFSDNTTIASVQNLLSPEKQSLTNDEVKKLIGISDSYMSDTVWFKDGCAETNGLHWIQYAQKNGEVYDLVNSDKQEGLSCSLSMTILDDDKTILTGTAKFVGLVSRDEFTPFPSIRAGYPKEIMGGFFNGSTMVSKNESSVVTYLQEGSYDVVNCVTLLLVSIEDEEPPQESLVTPIPISKMKGDAPPN